MQTFIDLQTQQIYQFDDDVVVVNTAGIYSFASSSGAVLNAPNTLQPYTIPPPSTEQLRAEIQAQITMLESKYLMPRPSREFMLILSVEKAASLGYTESQLYLANAAYKAVKDFDDQIVALRLQMEAIV